MELPQPPGRGTPARRKAKFQGMRAKKMESDRKEKFFGRMQHTLKNDAKIA